jgi:hypothetical protein
MPAFLTRLFVCILLTTLTLQPVGAASPVPPLTGSVPGLYDIGSPTLLELWINPVSGSDSNSGLSQGAPLKTLTAAWNKIPATLTTTGYRLNLLPGIYPCEPGEPDNCQNNFGNRAGTYQFPIILSAYGGPGTVTLRGGLDLANLSYLYLINLTLAGGTPLPTNSSGNNLLHLAAVDHILLRGLRLAGPACATDACNNLQEVLKVNQAQYLYVENSTIGGAWHTSVDYFAVQYGHFFNNNLHTAGQWCMYIKGGTSYLRIEGNELHNCQLGFSAGQSANFPMMRVPWLHYEAYDIKFVNNLLRDLPGVGLSVAGGYNILFAYNTLYRVGISSSIGYPLFSAVRGERGCNATDELPNPVSRCQNYISQGGWGPNFLTDNLEVIPNRNVYVYNNLFYNPAPARTQYTHLDIREPLARPAGFQGMPNPIKADTNLAIRGNVIWNGDNSTPLGIEGSLACPATNPTCNEAQLKADNTLNSVEPTLANPALGNFRPIGGWTTTTYAIPNFIWDIASVPAGTTDNAIPTDYEGLTRAALGLPGAFSLASPPIVLSITRANPSPTTAASVDFTVTFSETMTGVDETDFTPSGVGVTGATVSALSGSGAVYTVTVTTGSGTGALRLNLVDDDSIIDSDSNPLGGSGASNGNFTLGQSYIVRPLTLTYRSQDANDGWILESTRTSSKGGTLDRFAATLRVGDDAANRQYRSILSFDTTNLPDAAHIVSVTLTLTYQGQVGANPFTTHGPLLVAIRKPYFGAAASLLATDFQSLASNSNVGTFSRTGTSYKVTLKPAAYAYINLKGTTQFRLYFQKGDNNDNGADYLSMYSGKASNAALRPLLLVTYY